ncbi:MAG: DUF2330 domain-containing protein [Polyangiaceae bacterium]|jgi:hypothetical protein
MRGGFVRALIVAEIATLALLALGSRPASAFCGFYVSGADTKLFNDATNVVLLRDGNRTVLSMQNAYQGPPEAFAMVVPVPVVLQKENVKTLPRLVFDRVDQLAAPRLVEYWEQDPCARPLYDDLMALPMSAAAAAPMGGEGGKGYGVKIEAQFTVGEYDIVVLSAEDSGGLERWLHDSHYSIPAGAEPYLRPYVQAGSKFFVAKVDPAKVTFADGHAVLSPLRFHYDSDTFSLPIRLGLVNSGGTQDLVVNVLARHQRYEAANYPNVTIPTNLDVAEGARDEFGAFYAALFDRTLEKTPRAVVTEYSWDSGSCDPCPVPALDASELQTLGGDVIPNGQNGWDFVLTRLHARYSKDSLGEDIVFRPAAPIVGGREFLAAESAGPGSTPVLEKGSTPSSQNNFQARYVIRHPWSGAVACLSPHYGVWGGPPGTRDAPPTTRAAAKLAYAPRGGVELASVVRQDIPELGVTSKQPEESPRDRARWALLLGPGPLLGLFGIGAVSALLFSQRRRHV